MISGPNRGTTPTRTISGYLWTAVIAAIFIAAPRGRADEPYARSRDYNLEHSKIALRFDVGEKKVIGDVTHTLTLFRNGLSTISFDSVGLTIEKVTVDKSRVKFETTADRLIVTLPTASHSGERLEVEIQYEGKPTKGLYFILPDKEYPDQPSQIWTQGESEDTRYYLPTYDYPNDRLTTETVLTVPASWITVANGKLIGVRDAGKNMKIWTWKESVPSSTYLITVVAGEFDELKNSWREIPVTYYAPKGRGNRLAIDYGRTPAMMELFSTKLGVDYPWEKYAQAMVDDFVAGGMENSSATTNTSRSLTHPKLAPEYLTGEDDLISHELGHQWFGDLVTCKDWGDIWLNEGFATFMETVWTEAHYGKDEADYERWTGAREWFGRKNLFEESIVRHDFDDSSEFNGNAYGKGGWVLYMLRHELGDDAFYRGLKHYLEVNRGKNVVTADFAKAMEEATHTNIDQFLGQWVYGGGAPELELSYTYEKEKHEVALTVKQTQKIEGRVGLFRIPTDVEITSASGKHLYPVTVSKDAETFTFPAATAPLMVLFDKGDQVLETEDFQKDEKEWLYQLKNADELADRADAAVALGKSKGDQQVVAALGDALEHDKAWGVRAVAAESLGKIGGTAAARVLLEALETAKEPWVRAPIVLALGEFKEEAPVAAKLEEIARVDPSYRARAAALLSIAKLKTPDALETLEAAAAGDSPDEFLQNAALRAMGFLGDAKAVPLLVQWSVPGKPMASRDAAIASLARLDKNNHEITNRVAGYLTEPHFSIRMASIFALGARGDATATPALKALLKSDDLSIEMVPMIKRQIARLQHPEEVKPGERQTPGEGDDEARVDQRLDKLESLIREMNERLKAIEARLPPAKK